MWSIPVPIPANPLRYVNCYAIETARGPVLVDPGWPADVSWDSLCSGLVQIGSSVADVAGVLISHAHSDHHGLAALVRNASGCWVGMHPAEARELTRLRDGSALRERNQHWPDLCGVPPEERAELAFDEQTALRIGALEPDVLVEAGMVQQVVGRHVDAIWTPGHTPGHLCFRLKDEDLLLTGDHLLPRITAHVGRYCLDGSDALGTYLSSLRHLEGALGTADPEILPGHEYRFRGIGARVNDVVEHHRRRIDEVVAVVIRLGDPTAWSVAERLSWSRPWAATVGHRRRLAVSETLTHLAHAALSGRIVSMPGLPARWRPSEPHKEIR